MIKELRYWVQKVLPLVYDDSLSYMELLNKVCAKLNEVIELANGIDATIERDVEAIMNQWVEDGTFEELIDQTVLANLTDRISQAEDDIDSLESTTDGLSDDLGSLSDDVDALEGTVSGISDNIGDLASLDTNDKSSIVAAINEVMFEGCVTPEMYGAVGDGSTDDTTSVQSAISSGKPVLFGGEYKVTSALTSNGAIWFGSGKIKYYGEYVRNLITIEGVCDVSGISVDCNELSAVGIYVAETDNALFKGVSVSNCKNILTDNCSCSGIAIVKCDNANVDSCIIENVNRVTSMPGTFSSTGILVYAYNNATVHNCYVYNIHSSVESEECDGIFCSFLETPISNHAYIFNNTIIDCTGRFVKTQCNTSVVDNNKCENTVTFTSARYFQPISTQYGDFEITNNYIELGTTFERVYTHLFSASLSSSNVNVVGRVSDNVITGTATGSQRCRSLMYIGVSDEITGSIMVDVSNNNVIVPVETTVYLAVADSDSVLSGNISIRNNKLNIYQVFEVAGISNINDIYSIVEENTFTFSGARFSTETMTFNMLVVKHNTGLNEALNNYPLNYNSIKLCDIYYRGAVQAMQNVPSAMGNGTYLYLNKRNNFAAYCDIAHSTSLGILAF